MIDNEQKWLHAKDNEINSIYNLKGKKNLYKNIKIRQKLLLKSKKQKEANKINNKFFIKMIFILLMIISLFHLVIKKKNSYYSCFVGMGKQENRYVRELIEYYSKLGVEKFVFGDNNLPNTEKLSDVLQDYINSNKVSIIELFGSDFGQSELYNITYEKYKTKCEWFLFFDFDEYLEVYFEKNKTLTLKAFLTNSTFDKCESILFNWVLYTDNNLVYYDNRPLNERFTEPYFTNPGNIHVKSIVRGNLNKTIFLPKRSNHVPEKGVIICDSIGRIIQTYNPFSLPKTIYDYGYLKHFSVKTAEEYCDKILRGRPRNISYNINERVQLFFSRNKFSEEKLKVFESKFNRSFNSISYRNLFKGDKL